MCIRLHGNGGEECLPISGVILTFNHLSIIKFSTRPYSSVKEMNRGLIDRWNTVVQPGDTCWHLGDFGFPPKNSHDYNDLNDIFSQLNGRKCLVVGNHDKKNKQAIRLPWSEVEDLVEVKFAGNRATLCHYPLETWPASWHGAMMFHGHCHGTLKRKLPKRFDVGCDVEWLPAKWEDLVARSAGEIFSPVDGHGEGKEPDGD